MLLSIGKAAKKYSISRTTLKEWVTEGKLSLVKTPGGHHRFVEAEIKQVLGIKEDLLICR